MIRIVFKNRLKLGVRHSKSVEEPGYKYSVKSAEHIDKAEYDEVKDTLVLFDNPYYSEIIDTLEQNENNSEKDGDYILSGSDTRYCEPKEIEALTDEELRLARNEIYARHGRKFKDVGLKDYFSSKSWYTPERDDVPDSELNVYETANRDMIVKEEEQRK